jgi:hypothetical protein
MEIFRAVSRSMVLFTTLATLALPHDAWAEYGAVARGFYTGCAHPRGVKVFTYKRPSQAVADREAMALCVGGERTGCHIVYRFGKGRCLYFSASAGITECYHGYVIAYGPTPQQATAACDAERANSSPTCSAPQGGCND